MNYSKTIQAVIQTLRGLFKDKDKLVGVDDWDAFIGCLIALENVAADCQDKPETAAAEEVDDG